MEIILARYDEIKSSISQLDPIEDAVAWIHSLQSRAYTTDILRSVHGFTRAEANARAVRSVQTYAGNALGFLDQAYAGPASVSFLPLYYAVLNLSKVSVIAAGLGRELNDQRLHGASYGSIARVSHSLETETVILQGRGVYPLLYRALTSLPIGFRQRKIQMREISPYLSGVTYEVAEAFSGVPARQKLRFDIESKGKGVFRLAATLIDTVYEHPHGDELRYLKAISGFKKVSPKRFVSNYVRANSTEEAVKQLSKKVRRYLLYGLNFTHSRGFEGVDTPVNSSRMFLPEELPIWLALFHLSSVVRYHPEFLLRLENSKYWPVLLSLRKHSMLRYLILFWSNFRQKYFSISAS